MFMLPPRAACLSSVALLAGTSFASAEDLTIRMGSGHPIGLLAYTETAHEWFAPELRRRIEEETEHTITIQEFHAGQVAKVTEVLEATQDGILDIGFMSLIFEPSKAYLQTFTLFLPFSSPSAALTTEASKATFEAFPEMSQSFADEHNQIYLGGACAENYGLGSDFGWEQFSELQGHRIAGAGTNLEWIVGATPVASNLNEAYQSIQSGVYEGYISASAWWQTFKLNEVAPHFKSVDFGAQYVSAVTINKDTWEALPEDVQQILMEMGEEWGGVTAEICDRNDAEGEARLADLGVEVTAISAEAQAEWAEALADFPQRMADELNGRGQPGSEVLNFYISKLEELGHAWPYRYAVE
ncbi:TRAP transporter substrate-binding protein DctP [Tropicimonas sediminicola]|uniref:TRAP-type C4-dicarboxylate transport system, substrate-binding protein n=1 Tax=Tropicimonas sediminicola TaxID=1031541 RepID=A0A239LBB5_9RHOB|nr:TRAP transporter substrate-binding protein DctP [Tropicimonas sediminicola]SNT27761.1 TRAP-type C4-dicarboxylate transport system, substrate-binding protein [Tropicimonas sediminicola]